MVRLALFFYSCIHCNAIFSWRVKINIQVKIFTAHTKGFSPLHTACQKGDAKTVQRLLENWADVNLRDENGFTPLFVACKHGYKEIVQNLLEESAKHSKTQVKSYFLKDIF